jgi:hypothetical protein
MCIFFHYVKKNYSIFYHDNKQKDIIIQYDMLCLIFVAFNKLDHMKGVL